MFGLGKKKQPERWGGQWAIQKITRNNGKVRYAAAKKTYYCRYGMDWYWDAIQTYDTCKEAEIYIENVWKEATAKTEIITQCEECE